jgi:hypothetical protein
LETYRSGLGGSAWLLFLGVVVIVGSLVLYGRNNSLGVLLGGWIIGGLLGYIGYMAIIRSLKIERLRLAAHMLRSQTLHAKMAVEHGNPEAERLVAEMEREERGFITRAFRAANVNVEEAFVSSTIDSIKKGSEPPYIVVYRNGVFDAPSTLIANITGQAASAVFALMAFVLLGLIMLAVGVLITPIIVYTTARTLSKHANRENRIRQILGLQQVPSNAPGAGGLLLSIITLGLYLPLYASSLTKSIDNHVVHV